MGTRLFRLGGWTLSLLLGVTSLLSGSRGSVAAADELQYPLALAVGKDGAVYIADRDLPGVWKYADGKLTPFFKGSKKFRTPLNAVRCLAIDAEGKLLAGDSSTRDIYRFNDQGEPQPLTGGNVGIPMALAVAADGTIYASDLEIQRIVKVPAAGGEPTIVAELAAVRGLGFDGTGALWAINHGKQPVVKFSADGKERTVVVDAPAFEFSHHLAFDGAGTPFVIDGYAKTLWKIVDGKPIALAKGEPWKNPVGLAWSPSTGLIVADPHRKAVYKVADDGKITRWFPAEQ